MSLKLRGDLKSFERMIARAQALSSGRMSRAIAPKIAAGQLRELAQRGRSSQTNPQGKSWKRTKTGAALKWPSQTTLTVSIVGGKVMAKLSGPPYLAAQHAGWRRFSSTINAGGAIKRWKSPPRRILPKSAVPKRWAEPILKALNIGWRQFMQSTSVRRSR